MLYEFVVDNKQRRKHKRNKSKKSSSCSKKSSKSTSSTISASAIQNVIDKLRFQHHRQSTLKNYYMVWKQFNEFFLCLDRKPDTWEDRLTLFVGFLIEDDKKASTIRSYISAIKSVLRDDGVILNENKYLLSSLMKACSLRGNNSVRTCLPIQKGMLMVLLKTIEQQYVQQPFLKRLCSAILSTGYFGLFRIGELTSGTHLAKARDVHIAMNKNKIKILLRSSKTHWTDNKPQIIKISSIDFDHNITKPVSKKLLGSSYCPFQIMQEYAAVRGGFTSHTEPWFIFKDKSPVTPDHVCSVLKTVLSIAGFDPELYSFISLCSGRAGDLLDFGLSIKTMKAIGRWCSNSIFMYLQS